MTELETVILKNGTEEVKSLVVVTMNTLNKLFIENPIAFYELNEVCKNSAHKPFGNTGEILSKYSLIIDGVIHNSIKNIVISSIDGDGFDITLGSPIK